MPLQLLGRESTFDPWADGTVDSDRVVAVGAFLMALTDEPRDVAGAEALIGERVYAAPVSGAGVGLVWLVGETFVQILRLRDLESGLEWGVV